MFARLTLAALLLALPAGIAAAKCYPDASGGGQACEQLPAGANNTDASSASPSLAGLNLLGTLAATPGRRGFIVQAQDSAANCSTGGGAQGLIAAFDDGAGGTVTVLSIGYTAAKGGQGGSISMDGMPHTGRIRYYGTAGCQVGAAQW